MVELYTNQWGCLPHAQPFFSLLQSFLIWGHWVTDLFSHLSLFSFPEKKSEICNWWSGKSNRNNKLSPLQWGLSLFIGIRVWSALCSTLWDLALRVRPVVDQLCQLSYIFPHLKLCWPLGININKGNVFWSPSLWFPCLYYSWFWMLMEKEVLISSLQNPNIPPLYFQPVPSHWLPLPLLL